MNIFQNRWIMKQYLNSEQTAKLIELGFEKPKGWNAENISSRFIMAVDVDGDNEFNYSIGELISFLPKSIKVNDCYFTLTISAEFDNWLVEYVDIAYGSQAYVRDVELIDALFTEIVMLKEEGVI